MTALETASRHLSRDGFGEYLRSGVPSVIKIDGQPPIYMIVEPAMRKLALRTPWSGQSLPDLSMYQYIGSETVFWNDDRWCELRIEGENISEAYPVLCAVADSIQLQSFGFAAAVNDALDTLRELLSGTRRISEQQEVGLFGELIALESLIAAEAANVAIGGWRGPQGEEHDFGLPEGDIEIKTTTSEQRCHWIGNSRQLEPTFDRRLWLLSIQLTEAGAGGANLPEFIERLRARVVSDPVVDEFDRKLHAAGWRTDAAGLYGKRFRLRRKPEFYEIDSDFPAITGARLAAAGLEPSRFVQVRYMIDLEGLKASDALPSPMSLMRFKDFE